MGLSTRDGAVGSHRATSPASAFIPARIWAPMAKAGRWSPIIRSTPAPSGCCAIGERKSNYHHVLTGYNYRMEGHPGRDLRVKLRQPGASGRICRRAHAAEYTPPARRQPGCDFRPRCRYARHVYHVYAVRSAARDALQAHLQLRAIQTGIHYPTPVHLLEAWADLNYKRGDFPVSEQVAAEVLSVPMYAELTTHQIETVASAVRESADVKC